MNKVILQIKECIFLSFYSQKYTKTTWNKYTILGY